VIALWLTELFNFDLNGGDSFEFFDFLDFVGEFWVKAIFKDFDNSVKISWILEFVFLKIWVIALNWVMSDGYLRLTVDFFG
jgi:hypothetical protein